MHQRQVQTEHRVAAAVLADACAKELDTLLNTQRSAPTALALTAGNAAETGMTAASYPDAAAAEAPEPLQLTSSAARSLKQGAAMCIAACLHHAYVSLCGCLHTVDLCCIWHVCAAT
jgi:hypothetical protein